MKYLDEEAQQIVLLDHICKLLDVLYANTVSPDPDAPEFVTHVNPDDKELSGTDVFDVVTKNNQLDLDADDPEQNGQDTSGLFLQMAQLEDFVPPGDTTSILGPMMSMWYAWVILNWIYTRNDEKWSICIRITGL